MRRRRAVFLNDSILPAEDAHISVDDPGFLLGDGVFETCGAFNGTPYLLDEHLQRLRAGLRFVEIPEPDCLQSMARIVAEVVEANDLQRTIARVRITVSRGPGSGPAVLVSALPWEPPEGLAEGVVVELLASPVLVSPWNQVKSISRQVSVLAGLRRPAGVYDSLQCNTAGMLTEGTYSNVFCIASQRLFTPRIADGCLEGVTRATILRVATHLGIDSEETSLRVDDLAAAQEVFLTSSMAGVVPVRQARLPQTIPAHWNSALASDSPLSWSSPGALTQRLRDVYRTWQREATCPPN